jgi:hypothetical protein
MNAREKSKISDFVHSVIEKRTTQSEQLFKEIISPKILSALADRRMQLAKTIFKEAAEAPTFVLTNPLELDPKTKKPKTMCRGSKEECMAFKNAVKDPSVKAALKLTQE